MARLSTSSGGSGGSGVPGLPVVQFREQLEQRLAQIEGAPASPDASFDRPLDCVRDWLQGQRHHEALSAFTRLDGWLERHGVALRVFVDSDQGRAWCDLALESVEDPRAEDAFVRSPAAGGPPPAWRPNPGVRDRNYLTPPEIPGAGRIPLDVWIDAGQSASFAGPGVSGQAFADSLFGDTNLSVSGGFGQPAPLTGPFIVDADLLLVFLVTVLMPRQGVSRWIEQPRCALVARLAVFAESWSAS